MTDLSRRLFGLASRSELLDAGWTARERGDTRTLRAVRAEHAARRPNNQGDQ